jgi:hypothetical protein
MPEDNENAFGERTGAVMGVTRQTAIFIFVISTTCFGTVQVRNRLTFEGGSGTIEEFPLSPLRHTRDLRFVSRSSANNAGYLASWQIRDGTLFLSSFSGWVEGGRMDRAIQPRGGGLPTCNARGCSLVS